MTAGTPARQPQVSVVIPTHNRKHLLMPTLRSVMEQHGVDLEIVVVDDGSDDGTAAHLEDLRIENLRILRHERALGVGSARNTGMEAARGAWIALLDDDDLWRPDKLRLQLDAGTGQGRRWSYTGAVHFLPGPTLWRLDPAPSAEQLRNRIFHDNVVPAGSSNVLVRRALIDEVGGFDTSLKHMADWDMWSKLVLAGRPAVETSFLLAYRLHRENMSLMNLDGVYRDAMVIDERYAAERGGPLDLRPVLAWVAVTYWRAGRRKDARAIYREAARCGHPSAWLRVARTYVPVQRLRPLMRPRSQPTWPEGFECWLRQAIEGGA